MEAYKLVKIGGEENTIKLTRTTEIPDTIDVRIEDISRIERVSGANGGQTRVWFNSNNDNPYFRSNFHYYKESVEEIKNKLGL